MRANATSRAPGASRRADVRQLVIEGEIVATPIRRHTAANQNPPPRDEVRVRYVRRRRRVWNRVMRASVPTLAALLFFLFRIMARFLTAIAHLKAQTR